MHRRGSPLPPFYFPPCRFSSTSIRRPSLSSMRPTRKAIKYSASAIWISSFPGSGEGVDGKILLCPLAEPLMVRTPSGIAGHRPASKLRLRAHQCRHAVTESTTCSPALSEQTWMQSNDLGERAERGAEKDERIC
jgi:hypothetical protein